jgi:hypothetical protein
MQLSKKRFNYEIDNNALKIWLEKKNFSNNIIVTSNNFLIPKLIKSKGLYGFPANDDFLKKADYVIINKAVISYKDKMCISLSNCDFEKLYLEKIKKLGKFQIVFTSNDYVIYFKRH